MENQVNDTAYATAFERDPSPLTTDDDLDASPMERTVEMKRIDSLRIPVGSNLADVERWMIFATLQKCGGNKTRAAALLGVSLKTLYNRLNAYRAQGLTMDYQDTVGGLDDSSRGADGRDLSRGRSIQDNRTETQ